jgi:2-hydroxychromene-2-carboxylate isomerase
MKKKIVKFYFDPVSPYVYFALHKLLKVAEKHIIEIQSVPILFAGLLNVHGQKGPAEIRSKRKYIFLDSLRLSQIENIPLNAPPAHPFNPLLPLRVIASVDDDIERLKLTKVVIFGCWEKGLDISNENVLKELFQNFGFNGEFLINQANSKEVKKKLKLNTEEAIENGVFGVPTMIIDHQIFWGCDRVESLELYLNGKFNNLDLEKLQKILNIPRGADRKGIKF